MKLTVLTNTPRTLLRNIAIELSKAKVVNKLDFRLTTFGGVRKASLHSLPTNDNLKKLLRKLYVTFSADSFVLLIWNKWYIKWKKGEITPYITYDPLKDENQIMEIPLYKNGELAQVISPDKFNQYPVIVISPEWWEGEYNNRNTGNVKDWPPPIHFRTRPLIFRIRIDHWFDGEPHIYNPGWRMEIYTKTMPCSSDSLSHVYIDHSDFEHVDEAHVWYDVSGRIHPGMNRRVNYICEVWEDDNGLRFNDDFVGRFIIAGNFPHYVTGGEVEAICVNMSNYFQGK